MRLELLLVADYIIPPSDNTWSLNLSGAFALEFFWLCWFIIISTFSIVLFTYGPGYDLSNHNNIVIAAVLDIILTVTCLTLLLVAESQRCKNNSVCLPFGENKGTGSIEPFTAIIFLRVFRFFLADKIYSTWLSKFRGVVPSASNLDKSIRLVRRKSSITEGSEHESSESENKSKHKELVNLLEKSGTILELWNTAVGIRPDIATTYGEFSSVSVMFIIFHSQSDIL